MQAINLRYFRTCIDDKEVHVLVCPLKLVDVAYNLNDNLHNLRS